MNVKKGKVVKNPTSKNIKGEPIETVEEPQKQTVKKGQSVKKSQYKKATSSKVTKTKQKCGNPKKVNKNKGTRSSPPKKTFKDDKTQEEVHDDDQEQVQEEPTANRRPVWTDDEINGIVHSSVTRRQILRGSYKGPGGSRKRKVNGWKAVASKCFIYLVYNLIKHKLSLHKNVLKINYFIHCKQ